MKKYTIILLALMLVIGLNTATPVAAGELKEKRAMPSVTMLFPRVDDSIVSQYGEPPVWNDNPSTISEREALVKKAYQNVWHYLKACGDGVQFLKWGYIGERDSTQCGRDTVETRARLKCHLTTYFGCMYIDETFLSQRVSYVPIQRVADTYGRSVSKGETEKYSKTIIIDKRKVLTELTEEEFWTSEDLHLSLRDGYYTDELWYEIEIFPEFFEEERMFMEEEIGTPEGPWAKSALEAAEYVILHELGHFESYVSTQCAEYGLFPVSNDERQANVFASSVLRCR